MRDNKKWLSHSHVSLDLDVDGFTVCLQYFLRNIYITHPRVNIITHILSGLFHDQVILSPVQFWKDCDVMSRHLSSEFWFLVSSNPSFPIPHHQSTDSGRSLPHLLHLKLLSHGLHISGCFLLSALRLLSLALRWLLSDPFPWQL